jgi:hypothetical protein
LVLHKRKPTATTTGTGYRDPIDTESNTNIGTQSHFNHFSLSKNPAFSFSSVLMTVSLMERSGVFGC